MIRMCMPTDDCIAMCMLSLSEHNYSNMTKIKIKNILCESVCKMVQKIVSTARLGW